RRAGDDAVEEGRMALRHQHRLTPAGRTPGEVRAVGSLRVVLRDDLLREGRDTSNCLIGEVERGLLLLHEARVESPLTLMTGIGRDDGEAANERGRGA